MTPNQALALLLLLAAAALQLLGSEAGVAADSASAGASQSAVAAAAPSSASAPASNSASGPASSPASAASGTTATAASPTASAAAQATPTDADSFLSLTNTTQSTGCQSSVVTYSFLLYSPNITVRYQYLNQQMNITWGYSNPNAKVNTVQIFYKSETAPSSSWALAVNASGSDRTAMWMVKDIGADYYLLKLVANGKDNTVAGSIVCYNQGEVQTGVTSSPVYIFPMPLLQAGTTPYMPNGAPRLLPALVISSVVSLGILLGVLLL